MRFRRGGPNTSSISPPLRALWSIVSSRSQFLGAFVLVQPFQAAQRQADLARVENAVGAQVAIAPRAGDLNRGAAATAAADANAGGMLAAVAEGRRAAGADPAVAAVVALLLLFEQLAKSRGQLVEVEGSQLRPIFVADFRQDRVLEPFEQLVADVEARLDAGEERGERPIVGVVVRFALDQQAAGQMVKRVEIGSRVPFTERLHQRQPFGAGDLQAEVAQVVEESRRTWALDPMR